MTEPAGLSVTAVRANFAEVLHAAAIDGRATPVTRHDQTRPVAAIVPLWQVPPGTAGTEINITEARATLRTLVDAAERGQTTFVTNRGRRMAATVPWPVPEHVPNPSERVR